ncbi:hypothetical protein Pfo_007786 [Paulownia fortunei]|nr:hypothetical protein Pfo_007786 [Paulownia fortunei]
MLQSTGMESDSQGHICIMHIMVCREKLAYTVQSMNRFLMENPSPSRMTKKEVSYEQAAGLSSIPFVWVGEPQSILIQGRGKFNCNTPGIGAGLCNATNPESSPYALTVLPGKTFEIEGHNMTIVEGDGLYVEPFVVQNLPIYSGETYSVLIRADQELSRNYWLMQKSVSRNSTTPNGLTIFNYYPNHPRRYPPTRYTNKVSHYHLNDININKNDSQEYKTVRTIGTPDTILTVNSYGWTSLRFRADNPGVWAFHCHTQSHFYKGIRVVFEEGVERVGKLPTSIMGCGDTKGCHRP